MKFEESSSLTVAP